MIPRSIKPVFEDLKELIIKHHPRHITLEDLTDDYVDALWKRCDRHEMFHTDAERYMGDVYLEISHGAY